MMNGDNDNDGNFMDSGPWIANILPMVVMFDAQYRVHVGTTVLGPLPSVAVKVVPWDSYFPANTDNSRPIFFSWQTLDGWY